MPTNRAELPPVRIVRGSAADTPRLTPVFELYRAFYGNPAAGQAAESFLRERQERGESVVFLAETRPSNPCDEPAVVGFAQLFPTFSSANLRAVWILNDLFVIEAFRRRGVARELIHAAVGHARATGARSLALLTEETNTSAQQLYEAMGWSWDRAYRRYTLVVDG